MSDHQESPELNGMASIKDGHIQIRDPQPGGSPARIQADESVLVFVNEVLISEPVEVFSRTSIRVTYPLFTLPRYTTSLKIDPDYMAAWLDLKVLETGFFYHLQETPPSQELLVKALLKPALLKDFEEIRTEILGTLQKHGVVFGIREALLDQILETPPTEPVCIAQGLKSVFVPDSFEDRYAFPSLPEGPQSLNLPSFQLQYPVLKSCKAREVLVRRIPGRVESLGCDLKGDTLPTPEIHKPLLAADNSVRLQNEGCEVVASLEGIPSFNGRDAKVRSSQLFTDPIEGTRGTIVDVNGSAQIATDVLDQAQVWAGQHIEIQGQVSHALLEADENVIIHGNTVKAKIASGGDASASMRLIPPVKNLLVQMLRVQKLFKELKQTVPELAQRSDKLILTNLIKTQFPQLLPEAEQLWQQLKLLKKLHPRKVMVLKIVLSHLLNLGQKDFNAAMFNDWVDKLGDFLIDLESLENLSSHVYLGYVQGSEVISQGHIYILGEGCYNSRLQARQSILITGSPGYCREGRIEVGAHLIVRELGSPNGSRLKVQLTPTGRVYAQLVHPGVELRFGKAAPHHVLDRRENIEIYFENNAVKIETLKNLI
jgi:uncharacterized protein